MNIKTFIDSLAENIFIDTPKQSLNEDTEYMELEEWTSMAAFTLISYIENTYGKKLMLPELLQAQTIGELYQLVNV
jgi:acyl carrier protein